MALPPRGTPDVVGGSRCLIHVGRNLGTGALEPLQVPRRLEGGEGRVSRRRGGVLAVQPRPGGVPHAAGFRGTPRPGRVNAASPGAEEGEAAAGTPEGAGPAPAAPRELCPGLPSPGSSPGLSGPERQQILKELLGEARRYVCGERGQAGQALAGERGRGEPPKL